MRGVRFVSYIKYGGLLVVALVCLGIGLYSLDAHAAEKRITAEFIPDPNNPSHRNFLNTTPNEGYCGTWPNYCATPKMFSIRFPVDFDASQALTPEAAAADPRKAAYFLIPAAYRSLTVFNDVTGASAEVKMRISGIGQKYYSKSETWHDRLWVEGPWSDASAPCQSGAIGISTKSWFASFWKVPATARTACVKRPAAFIPLPFRYREMIVSYELITPDPFSMDMGNYYGSLTYTVGPGGDFDFGDVMVASDNQVTFNFELQVNHYLAVDFPAGAYRAVLQPKEGWQGWLNSGRAAPALSANQAFKISSFGRFKVYLECEYSVADTCGIQTLLDNGGSHTAGVDISVSMPAGIVAMPGEQSVRRKKLRVGAGNAAVFKGTSIQFSRVATMHYDIPAAITAEMVNNPGKTYRGGATIIFDGNI